MLKQIKNYIGKLIGYPSCFLTKDTLWHESCYGIPLSDSTSVLVSARAVKTIPPEKIAEDLLKNIRTTDPIGAYFPLEQIAAQIPGGCIFFPKTKR